MGKNLFTLLDLERKYVLVRGPKKGTVTCFPSTVGEGGEEGTLLFPPPSDDKGPKLSKGRETGHETDAGCAGGL